MKKLLNLTALLSLSFLVSCANPIGKNADESVVSHNPLDPTKTISSLSTAFNERAKFLVFFYDQDLPWMPESCKSDLSSGALQRAHKSWQTSAKYWALKGLDSVGVNSDASKAEKELVGELYGVSLSAPERSSERELYLLAKGALTNSVAYQTFITKYEGNGCTMGSYKDRLSYMNSRLGLLGYEQDKLYAERFYIERQLLKSQRGFNKTVSEKMTSEQKTFGTNTFHDKRLQKGIELLKLKIDTLKTKYETALAAKKDKIIAADLALKTAMGDVVPATAVQYKCKRSEFAVKDQFVKGLESTLGLTYRYRCADTDVKGEYAASWSKVKKVTSSLKSVQRKYLPFERASSKYGNLEADKVKRDSGERDNMQIHFCSIEVDDTYDRFDEDGVFCEKYSRWSEQLESLPINSNLKLCELADESDTDIENPMNEHFKDSKKSIADQCQSKVDREKVADKTVENGDDWLRKNSARLRAGKLENEDNLYLCSSGNSTFDFTEFNTSGKAIINLCMMQNTVWKPADNEFGRVEFDYSVAAGDVYDVDFDGNSLKFKVLLKNLAGERTGARMEFELNVAVFGGVRKLHGKAFHYRVDGTRQEGMGKIALD
ncbi:MAG: hypothetical protein HOE90_18060 [Bacteriovoracaceae bacterium]|nr:hypothetical protein [Bacteriovoracaceae bacterium]